MKKYLAVVLLSIFVAQSYAQSEPNFIGEVLACIDGKQTILLPKEKVNGLEGLTLMFVNFGYSNSELYINNPTSLAEFDVEDNLTFIVKSVNQNLDPQAYLKIIRLGCPKNDNRRVYSSTVTNIYHGALVNVRETNFIQPLVSFIAEKYGESSYLVKTEKLIPGQYAIVTASPNNIKEVSDIFATFGLIKNLNAKRYFMANKHNEELLRQTLDKTINYLLEHKMRPIKGGDHEGGFGAPTFDIFSETYINYYEYVDLYGRDFRNKLIEEYRIARKTLRKSKKMYRKSMTSK
jgi:hypothetical protein